MVIFYDDIHTRRPIPIQTIYCHCTPRSQAPKTLAWSLTCSQPRLDTLQIFDWLPTSTIFMTGRQGANPEQLPALVLISIIHFFGPLYPRRAIGHGWHRLRHESPSYFILPATAESCTVQGFCNFNLSLQRYLLDRHHMIAE